MNAAWTRWDLNRSNRRDSTSGSSLLKIMNQNSKVLSLKYRPKNFNDLIGQDIVAQTISNSIKLNKIPNAYLFTGIRGIGKTTIARIVAKSLNCKNGFDDNLCSKNICENCEDIVKGNATFATIVFISTFRVLIERIDELNECKSLEGFIQYIYHDRANLTMDFLPNITQAILTHGNTKFKGEEIHVARLISLYNEYCEKVLKNPDGGKAKYPSNNANAIGYTSDVYLTYMKSADTDVRGRFIDVSKGVVSWLHRVDESKWWRSLVTELI